MNQRPKEYSQDPNPAGDNRGNWYTAPTNRYGYRSGAAQFCGKDVRGEEKAKTLCAARNRTELSRGLDADLWVYWKE